MHQRLSLQNIIGMGFMVFAMFLGAGNLIFPPMAGQLAGTEVWQAAAGFLLTGVGLPLLGIIMIAKVGGGFNEITRELPHSLVVFIGSFIFIIIGPVYAVPRTGMVAYEIGFAPFLETNDTISRLIYSLVFFGLSWFLSLYPGKLLEYIGKVITPALIILLIVLGSSPFFQASPPIPAATGSYAENAFVRGFLEGYMTMDALAALMFGIVIVTNLRSHGITSASSLFRHSVITGVIAATGLGLVYLSLFNLGATSHAIAPEPENGAQILSEYVYTLFGTTGSILLASVVTLACLTTAIGCITAASEYFSEQTSRVSYKALVTIISGTCVVFATLGLNQIIELFIPVLLILYPVCIALIMLGLIRNLLPNPKLTYRITLLITFLLSLVDAGKNIEHPLIEMLITPFQSLPGHDANLSWIAPSLICVLLTIITGKLYPQSIGKDQIGN